MVLVWSYLRQSDKLTRCGGAPQGSGGGGGTANNSFTKTTTTTNANSRLEAGLLHERSGGSNTVFDVSTGSQATCTHQYTYEYHWDYDDSFNNNNYSVSASNASSHQNYQANGTLVPAGFYAVVDNKTTDGCRVRWYRNDTNTQVNVKYHTIVVTGSRNETTSQTIPVSANGSGGGALQGGVVAMHQQVLVPTMLLEVAVVVLDIMWRWWRRW